MSRTIARAVPARFLAVAVGVVLLVLVAAGTGLPQETADFGERAGEWQATVEAAEKALSGGFENADPGAVQSRLKALTQEVGSARREAEVRLSTAQEQLQSLGPPPKAEAPPELPEVALLREDIQERVSVAEAEISRAKLLETRAKDLLESIAAWEQERVRAQLLYRRPPPLELGVWREALQDTRQVVQKAVTAPKAWWQEREEADGAVLRFAAALAVPFAGLLVGWPLRRWALRHFGRDPEETDPSYARRIVASFVDGVANALVPVAMLGLAVMMMARQGLLTGLFGDLVYALGTAMAIFLVVLGISRAALSPHLVAWRIVPVEPGHAPRLLRAIRAVAGVFAVSTAFLFAAYASHHLTPALESAFYTVQTTISALVIAWALTPAYWTASIAESQAMADEAEGAAEDQAPPEPDRPGWASICRPLQLAVLLTPLLAFLGYGRLGFYVQSRLVATVAVVGFALLLRLALHEILERLAAGRMRRSGGRTGPAGAGEGGNRIGQYWAGLAVDVLLFVPLIYLLLLLYGVPATTLGLWTSRLLAGVTVGGITISPTEMLTALGMLALGIVVTNLIRGWLANRVLPNTRFDSGVQNSIAAGTRYTGVGLSILLAVAALGIDFSNLALVAGALSLGIGFGLQNVVQNFAAGLLLLIERPVKVGDWVVVGETEGTVKHISVRSTEIETFDRSSVIVPNSDLASTAVTNWTHKNRIARLTVRVGVAHGSDARQVAQVLLRCAEGQEHVLRYPEPMALFLGFGEYSLQFELRCFVSDTAFYLSTLSELHFAVDEAFREEGIIIPVPRRDLRLHAGGSPAAAGDTARAG